MSDVRDYQEVSGANNKSMIKKQPSQNQSKDIRQRCEQIFQLLKCHENIELFLKSLDPNHPKFKELMKDFINLNSIELNFKQGKYQSTFQLGVDFRKMFTNAFRQYAEDPVNKART